MNVLGGQSGAGRGIAQTPFSLQARKAGAATIIELIGSCTMEVSEQVGRRMLELASGPSPRLVVDMSRLDFIESLGLGGLVAGYLRAQKNGGQVRLCCPQPPIREVLETTRLTLLFSIHDRLEDALA